MKRDIDSGVVRFSDVYGSQEDENKTVAESIPENQEEKKIIPGFDMIPIFNDGLDTFMLFIYCLLDLNI